MNIMSVVISVKIRRQISTGESEISKARKNAEVRLAVVGLIISASYVSSVVFLFLWELATSNVLSIDGDEMSNLYYDSFDTFTLCNPYLLLILSGTTRTAFFRFIDCRRFVNKVTNQTTRATRITRIASSVRHS